MGRNSGLITYSLASLSPHILQVLWSSLPTAMPAAALPLGRGIPYGWFPTTSIAVKHGFLQQGDLNTSPSSLVLSHMSLTHDFPSQSQLPF